MLTETSPNTDAPSMPVRVVAGLLSAAFLGLGVAEIIVPGSFVGTYGTALTAPEGLPFISGIGARNIALSLIGLVAAFKGLRSALALLFLGLTIVPALEFATVATAAGPMAAIRFAIFAVLLALMTAWTALSRGSKS
ncbi:DUF4267 domain-containing protein [Celeribacter baekdonensis]|uniref:DoxX family protein n=1 Tax=Celeribacter baekdonensis TaxID=875171 RepID=A0A2R4LXV4_9RHOB|nr:DUF4267 domain-containing protein [Celeribacter baekdonensis]AVW89708.1 hypothetical protein DA792_00395 [Celeribacter baekdonensis]